MMGVRNFRTTCCKAFLLVAAISLVCVTVFGSPVSAQVDAASAISSAKNKIVNCFDAAREAEAAGANITVLTGTLNEAGSLLSQAELAYSTNDFDAAANFATQSQNKLSSFIAQADALGQTATQRQSQAFLINVVGSVVGAFVVAISSAALWFFLKKRHEK